MKIQYKKIKNLLQEHRVFVGGQSLEKPLPFYSDSLIIEVPENFTTEPYCTYWGKNALRLASMGSFSYTRSVLPKIISVGRYSSIGNGLQTLGDRHPHEWISTCPSFYSQHSGLVKILAEDTQKPNHFHSFDKTHKSIKIGNDVWIGQNVTLAQGITIGDGAVIAGNSLIVKDVPPYTIMGGNPAKPIRLRFNESIIDALQSLKWWKYSLQDFSDLDVANPYIFCQQLSDRVISGKIHEFKPKKLNYSDVIATTE